MKRIKEYDGLRALAFLGVFFAHAVPRYGNGWDVDLFLVLSAYLLVSRLVHERETTGRVDVLAFYERRVRRIWPLYFIALAIAWYVHDSRDWGYSTAALFFCLNFYGAIHGHKPSLFVGPMWSVSLEEQFYAAIPWLARSWKTLLVAAWVLLIVGVLGRSAVYLFYFQPMWSMNVFRLDALAVGILLATEPRLSDLPSWGRWPLLVLGVAVMFTGQFAPTVPRAVLISCVAVGGGMMVVGSLGNPVLSHPVLAWFGERSYGLYLFHGMMLELFCPSGINIALPFDCPAWPLALVCTVILAAFSYRFIEQPVMRAGDRVRVESTHDVESRRSAPIIE